MAKAIAALVISMVAYALAVSHYSRAPRQKVSEELNVALPVLAQVPLAAGDRYLAANIAVFRAMVVGTELLAPSTYRILGEVQASAAKLNPAHEDNYYIAQAVLPWAGEVEANEFIQRRATEARTWDALPPFFLGFSRFYFSKDPTEGATIMKIAADRSESNNRLALTNIAGKWYERGDDPRNAIALIRGLWSVERHPQLKQMLAMRIARLEGLIALREAAEKYTASTGARPRSLEDLVRAGALAGLPADPLGFGYTLNDKGEPELVQKAAKEQN